MRRTRHRLTTIASDDQLIEQARDGDQQAFGELYQRHRKAAESTARWMLRSRGEVDDVVSDAFAGVLAAINNGNGPRDNFRSYLLASVRNGCRLRWQRSMQADRTARPEADDTPVFEDPERFVEADTVARAFSSLNPRWQQTLWLTEVEQRSPAEVAAHLHLAPNATAALTHRAREAFATAYLAEHIDSASDEACERYAPRLAGYVRDQLTNAQRLDVEQHLVECQRCQEAVEDLRDVNASLRKLLPPATTALAAPWTVGTTLTSLTTVPGLFSSGLLLKGATALLVATPLLFNVTGGFGDGGAPDEEAIRTVVAEPPEAAVAPEPDVAVPSLRPASTLNEGLTGPTATTPSSVVSAPPTTSAPSGAGESMPVTPPPGGVMFDHLDPVLDPVVDGVVDPLVDDVLDPLVDDVVDPVVEGVVVPLVDDVVDPLVEGVVDPLVDGVVDPVVEGVVDPLVDDVVAPLVDDVVAPVVEDVVGPVIDGVVVPVVDEVVVPVVDDVVGPVVDDVVGPVIDEVVTPVIDDVVGPVVDDVVAPVVDDVVTPVVDDVVGPVVDDVVAPVVDDVVTPVVDESLSLVRLSTM